MLIKLNKSKLFTIEPDKRFCAEFKVKDGTWDLLWIKYIGNQYTIDELQDYFLIKTGRTIARKSVKRWISRTRVYDMAIQATKKGAVTVSTSFFQDHEQYVLDELLRPMKYGGAKKCRLLV